MNPEPNPLLLCERLAGFEALNRGLALEFRRLRTADYRARTHFFAGRYENLYVDTDRIPGVAALLSAARSSACRMLDVRSDKLRCGFWFNAMLPGQVTGLHTHDEEGELLSGVYFVLAPEGCGDLVFPRCDPPVSLTPRAGELVFFSPDREHEVESNRSSGLRLSIGMNFGRRDV